MNYIENMPNLMTIMSIPRRKAIHPPLREITKVLFCVKSLMISPSYRAIPNIFKNKKNIETSSYPSEYDSSNTPNEIK